MNMNGLYENAAQIKRAGYALRDGTDGLTRTLTDTELAKQLATKVRSLQASARLTASLLPAMCHHSSVRAAGVVQSAFADAAVSAAAPVPLQVAEKAPLQASLVIDAFGT